MSTSLLLGRGGAARRRRRRCDLLLLGVGVDELVGRQVHTGRQPCNNAVIWYMDEFVAGGVEDALLCVGRPGNVR